MSKNIHLGSALAAVGVAALACSPARADYVFQTATAGAGGQQGVYSAYGDGTDLGSNFIGATFSLSSATSALQVGANVDGFGVGGAFAEVVAVSSLAALPSVSGSGGSALVNYLKGSADLGNTVFNAPASAGDVSGVINFSGALAPGNYALILGSGLFGASGSSVFGVPTVGSINLTDTSNGNVTIGTPNIFSSTGGDSFQSYTYDTGMRIFAAPVPVPAAMPLMLSGLGGLFAFMRRRKIGIND